MEREEEKFEVLKTKLAQIIIPDWDWEIDMDDILRIRYDNIFGEVITIPVLENRVGRLVSELREHVKKEKLRLSVKEAELRKLFRKERSSDGQKKPTIQEEEDYLLTDPITKNKRFRIIEADKFLEDMEVFYEAVKSKAFKLNNLSKSLHPEEYEKELIEGKVNNVIIKIREKRYS